MTDAQKVLEEIISKVGIDAVVKKLTATDETKNPFKRGPHFSLKEQARLYSDEKTRKLAVDLAAAAGIKLPSDPTPQELKGRIW